ncbi:hypothetical protein KP509_36G059800 [Ceratopteris richardii]|nr:hypothetical protein KP509_36G059800 [Ceratopteris richardii]
MHVDIARLGILDQTLFVANALLDMYLSCALLDKAQEVFNNFTVKNVVMWTSLITGYVKVGLGEKAFQCYKEMQDSGYSPDTVTFICTLKACSTVGAARRGQEVHAEIERLGIFKKDVVVGNTLVDMYVKCGWLTKAREVLDEMPLRNVVSWTALITGCVDCGYNEEALQCSEEMQLEGVIPNSVTYIGCLRACGGSLDVETGTKIHGEIEQRTLFKNNLAVGCALVDMYAKCGLLSRAQDIFDKLSVRNSVLWNALITGYAECGYLNNALYLLGKMQQEGFAPDASTFISMLKACGTARDIDVGSELHAAIKKRRSLECDPFIGSSLIDMYAHCGLLSKAQEVFESLSAKDVIVWNSLMTGFLENGCDEEALICYEKMQDEEIMPDPVTFVCALKACGIMKALSKGEEIHSDIARCGNLEKDSIIGNSLVDMYAKNNSLVRAKEVFDGLLCQDTVSWNSLIAGYVQHGEGEQAIDCYEQMQMKGMFPNSGTFILGLKACSSIGAMGKGQAIHVEIERKGLLQNDILVGTAVIDMYAKHGSMLLAYEVFNCLPVRNVISWNTLLTGYTSLGECEHVIELFERMLEEGVNASWVTFVIVLNACSQMGLVKQGETYYKCMLKDYGVTPSLEHQICMIDLLGRAGYVDEAFSIVKKLPSFLDPSVWHSVLGACGRLGNSKVGNEVFRLARHIGRRDSSIYGLMSSIYVAGDISEETEMANLPKAPLDFLCFPSTFWWNDKYESFSSPLFQYTV